MAAKSKIEWTTHTFNPWRGCTKVSAGCANCYAETLSGRNPKTLGVWGPQGTRVVASESMWREPVKWNREAQSAYDEWHAHGMDEGPPPPRPRVFCASLADVFEDWTDLMSASDGAVMHVCSECGAWRTMEQMCHGPNAHMPLTMADVRRRLFGLIDATPNLDWLLLTKRPENISRMMPSYFPGGYTAEAGRMNQEGPRPNVWLGTSVENQQAAYERIPHLLRVPAAVRFLSCEPLLGPVDLSQVRTAKGTTAEPLRGIYRVEYPETVDEPGAIQEADGGPKIDWVIVGGESGPGARPMHPDWVRSLRDQCQAAGVPFFFKQHGDWMAGDFMGRPDSRRDARPYRYVSYDGSTTSDNPESAPLSSYCVYRVGKRAAGRLLDGREWNEFPAVEAAS